jgi:hypothetical protein
MPGVLQFKDATVDMSATKWIKNEKPNSTLGTSTYAEYLTEEEFKIAQ